MKKHLDIKIYGEVQGVGFRYYSQGKADELGLFGFVKNQDDGSIRIEVEGEEKSLDQFLEWTKVGPQGAKVERLEETEGTLINYTDFKIK